MPFAEEMGDIYDYGIHGAVKEAAAGFLCERADLSSFTGDVMDPAITMTANVWFTPCTPAS